MMRIILLAFIAIVGLSQSQRTPKPPPPPPGFESGSGSKGTGISFTGKNQNRNRESSARPQGFSPFTSKWVYCNGSWKLVMFTMKESKEWTTQHPQLFRLIRRPVLQYSMTLTSLTTEPSAGKDLILFVSPILKATPLSTSGPLYGVHSPSTSGFWHYNTNTNQYSYCADLPCCLCQACCERRW